jgi:sirohydrochlorin cobaltochelatase
MFRRSTPLERDLAAMEARLKTILPETYQDRYEEVQPVSMGTAKLKYAPDGNVAWDDIWGSFCDLAMAGGPPHKGKLLAPGSPDEVAAEPESYRRVTEEICRGIRLVANLKALPSAAPGWVRVDCLDRTFAQWLVRAITMENISAYVEEHWLDLPAGPAYRVEKEIKNVVTSVAKTSHYWDGHMWRAQRQEIARIFETLNQRMPLLQPAKPPQDDDTMAKLSEAIATRLQEATGLTARPERAVGGWLALNCPDVRSAIWMMRALVVGNVLARREEDLLFVPVNPGLDPTGSVAVEAVKQVHAFAKLRAVL